MNTFKEQHPCLTPERLLYSIVSEISTNNRFIAVFISFWLFAWLNIAIAILFLMRHDKLNVIINNISVYPNFSDKYLDYF